MEFKYPLPIPPAQFLRKLPPVCRDYTHNIMYRLQIFVIETNTITLKKRLLCEN